MKSWRGCPYRSGLAGCGAGRTVEESVPSLGVREEEWKPRWKCTTNGPQNTFPRSFEDKDLYATLAEDLGWRLWLELGLQLPRPLLGHGTP